MEILEEAWRAAEQKKQDDIMGISRHNTKKHRFSPKITWAPSFKVIQKKSSKKRTHPKPWVKTLIKYATTETGRIHSASTFSLEIHRKI